MSYEESAKGHVSCPPTKVNEWVEQQMAAIRAEAERNVNEAQEPAAVHLLTR